LGTDGKRYLGAAQGGGESTATSSVTKTKNLQRAQPGTWAKDRTYKKKGPFVGRWRWRELNNREKDL